MRAELRPCGDRAVLVDLPDEVTRRALDAELRSRREAGWLDGIVVEQVPAARTVLLRTAGTGDPLLVVTALRQLLPTLPDPDPEAPAPATGDEAVVPVHYDGQDLEEIAQTCGVTAEELVAWHTARPWLVDFSGFMPGFGYLVREPDPAGPSPQLDRMSFPRRPSPRTRIPAGSVALAGPWTGIYPQASSGGWQLIGRTELPTWDLAATPPAVLRPGRRIRFEEVR